jgi:predicted AlkP superfamily pyrophosphatase or phosphodiesterase
MSLDLTGWRWRGDGDQWDVLIGHGLGVDHAGHIFGVDSAAMRVKLAQTNELIQEVTAFDHRSLL